MDTIDDTIDFARYMAETDARQKVKTADSWTDGMKLKLREKKNCKKILFPWPKTAENFEFREGEVTVWGGINGHGKSLITSQVALSLVGQCEKVCMASFEMKPQKQLERFYRMYCGLNPYSPEFQQKDGIEALDKLYEEFGEWTSKFLWLYDQQGTTNSATVLGMIKYCAKELGIKHIFIDNLAKVVKGEDDFNGQKEFIDQVCAIARDLQIHVHIVHHMRKGNKETDPLDKNDFKGSGAIADQVDNLIGIWRNKAKELEYKTQGSNSPKGKEPDATLRVFKQRNHDGQDDGEPLVFLWFHKDSWQFLEHPGDSPMFFPNWPHRPS